MKIFKSIILFMICLMFVSVQAQTVALTGARIIPISSPEIETGVIIIENGRISAIGADVPVPEGARIIDCTGKTLMPGLIDGFTNLGIADLPAFGSDDDEVSGAVSPHLRVIDALNPENSFLAAARRSGVTAALCAPADGNLLSGQSAVIRLSGTTPEAMTMKFPAAVNGCMGLGPIHRFGSKKQQPMTRMGVAALLRQTFIDVQAYEAEWTAYEDHLVSDKKVKPKAPVRDFKKEALRPVLKGSRPLMISLNRMDDILTALRIADEFGIKLILGHCAEAARTADLLAEKHVPVVLGPFTVNPLNIESRNQTAATAVKLFNAGVKFAFQTGSISQAASLFDQARLAVQYGLPVDAALKALTLNASEIFGVQDEIGSLDVGKQADILILSDYPFSVDARVEQVIISGIEINTI